LFYQPFIIKGTILWPQKNPKNCTVVKSVRITGPAKPNGTEASMVRRTSVALCVLFTNPAGIPSPSPRGKTKKRSNANRKTVPP
ncbi:hypothetical protein ACFL5Y_03855, partial [Candidatus Omnitrophota bacterium]